MKLGGRRELMKEDFNYGLAYLRVFLCFMVVYLHFGNDMSEPLHFVGMCAVPCFVMMSFFFTAGRFLEGDARSQFKRLGRFAYPMVAWGMVSVALCLIFGDKLTARAVLEQLLLGMPHQDFILANHNLLDFPLWFEGSMICTSLFFMLVSHCFREKLPAAKPAWWMAAVLISALALQHASFIPWGELLSQCHYVFLTLFFCIPYASLGLLLSRYRLLGCLVPFRGKAILFSAACAVAVAFWHARQPAYMFYYGGLRLLIESLLIFTISYLLPLRLDGVGGKMMMLMSRHSMGIYCVHWLIGSRLLEFAPAMKAHLNGWAICALVYIISLAVATAIGSLKSHWAKDLVR